MKPKRLIYGVGVNDADYAVVKYEEIDPVEGKRRQKKVWYYRTWSDMLNRCYTAKLQERRPTYKGCTVAADWHTFSNFKRWMETQDFEGLQIDKDLLIVGNKVYSPETCIFVTGAVNNFVTDSGAARGELLIGVSWDKEKVKFRARCSNPFTNKREHLGYFTCEKEAHQAWLKRKNELAHELAEIQTDERVAEALRKYYSKPLIQEH